MGREPWVIEGQDGEPTPLVDILPGPEGSAPDDFRAIENRALFSAMTATGNRECFVSDGTPEGTLEILRPPGVAPAANYQFIALGNSKVLIKPFLGTPFVYQLGSGHAEALPLPSGGTWNFHIRGAAPVLGGWILATDSPYLALSLSISSAGIRLYPAMSTIATKSLDSRPVGVVNGAALVHASLPSASNQLYSLIGETVLHLGSVKSIPKVVGKVGGRLYYSHDSRFNSLGIDGRTMLAGDESTANGNGFVGALAGTFYQFPHYSKPRPLTILMYYPLLGGKVGNEHLYSFSRDYKVNLGTAEPYFLSSYDRVVSNPAYPQVLTRIDTRKRLIHLVEFPGTHKTRLDKLASYKEQLLFAVKNLPEESFSELWRTNGLPGGTEMVTTLDVRHAIKPFREIPIQGGVLFFVTDFNTSELQLWHSNATAEGTFRVHRFPAGTLAPEQIFQIAGRPYYLLNEGDGLALYSVSPIPGGVGKIFSLHDAWAIDAATIAHEYDSEVLLRAVLPNGDTALIKTDGTEQGTKIHAAYPHEVLGIAGHTIYGTYFTPETGKEPWTDEISNPGDIRFFDVAPGAVGNVDSKSWISAAGRAYLLIEDGHHGLEWWTSYGGAAVEQVTLRGTDTQNGIAEFGVIFTEPVQNFDESDIRIVRMDYRRAQLESLQQVSQTEYAVRVRVGGGDGSVGIRLRYPNDITDQRGNPLGPPTDQQEDGIQGPAAALGRIDDAHTADVNKNGILDLSELLRIIQLYNAGVFAPGIGEDGYGPPRYWEDIHNVPHDLDYRPRDWQFSLAEVLRAVQYFNTGGYRWCPDSEDGFCPGRG